MSEREESLTERMVRERPWRVHEAERREPCKGLADLFQVFSESRTNSFAARGLVQGIVLATGDNGNPARRDDEDGRNIRELIVAFLADIGSESPLHAEHDPEVRKAARRTLAQHVCPMIAHRYHGNPSEYPDHIATLIPENLGTLNALARFYALSAGNTKLEYPHLAELDGNHFRNVRECLMRVYRELRRHFQTNHVSDAMSHPMVAWGVMLRLNGLFVNRCWWGVLSRVRAVSTVSDLYDEARRLTRFPILSEFGKEGIHARERIPATSSEALLAHLQFDWYGMERYRRDDITRAFLEQHRDVILHDLCAVQIVAGGAFDVAMDVALRECGGEVFRDDLRRDCEERGRQIQDKSGLRPLLLDLVATFVREMELAHPGVLVGR